MKIKTRSNGGKNIPSNLFACSVIDGVIFKGETREARE